MSFRRFSLLPFSETGPVSNIQITGEISRLSGRLAIYYELSGHLMKVEIPEPADQPVRRNALWEETCFELFLSAQGSSGYWEFNLSPAGHWNIFRFRAYRQGMHEDAALSSLPFSVLRQSGAVSLSIEIDLDRTLRRDQMLAAGICAVIKHRDGALSHWSLSHPGPQADFHRRDGFLIELSDEGRCATASFQ